MQSTRAFKVNEQKALKWETVDQILSEFDKDTDVHVNDRILDPQGGEIYLFYTCDPLKYNDWRADGYIWKNMGANKSVPPKDPVLLKSYFHAKNTEKIACNEFKREIWVKIGLESPVLIHYFGNNSNFKPGPHGNIKDKESASAFQRTLPSILTQLKEKVVSKDAHMVYKENNKKSRNLKQCQNIRYVNKFKALNQYV